MSDLGTQFNLSTSSRNMKRPPWFGQIGKIWWAGSLEPRRVILEHWQCEKWNLYKILHRSWYPKKISEIFFSMKKIIFENWNFRFLKNKIFHKGEIFFLWKMKNVEEKNLDFSKEIFKSFDKILKFSKKYKIFFERFFSSKKNFWDFFWISWSM